MNAFKLALFNAKNNIRLYKFNIITMIFSIAIFLNFFSLIFNPDMDLASTDKLQIKITLYMVTILLTFFLLFFIAYSNSFFLKQRKKEIGIYTFMGVENSKIGKAFSYEVMILGFTALILGLLSGLLFQKAFLMILNKVANINREIQFDFSKEAIIITIVVFLTIYLVSALIGFISIQKSNLLDLLNAEKEEEKFLKIKYVTGILSIILIGIAYFFAKDIFGEEIFLYSSLVMFCIIIGTLLFFKSFLSIIIKFMINRKKIFYNGTNIISISNVAYRIGYNYKTLACISLIVAATITAIGTSFSIDHLFSKTINITHPYSFSYITDNEDLNYKVKEEIESTNHKITKEVRTNYLLYNSQNERFPKYHPIIKASDFNKIIWKLNNEEKEELKAITDNLKGGEGVEVSSTNDSGFKDNEILNMIDYKLEIKETLDIPLLGAKFTNNTIVIADDDYDKYKESLLKIEDSKKKEEYKERTFCGISLENQNESLELSERLLQIPELHKNLNSYVTYYISYNELTGVIKFTGLFLGVVFMIITASIMYMKIMSDAISDKQKYNILNKIGISEDELGHAISKQVGLSYIMPLLVGSIHALVAIAVLQKFFEGFLEISLIKPFLISVIVYIIVYIIFYMMTTKKFVKLVTE